VYCAAGELDGQVREERGRGRGEGKADLLD